MAPEFQRYFGSRLHDSYVIATEREGNDFLVHLSHDGTEDVIAKIVAECLKKPKPMCQWPITLAFHGVDFLRWALATPSKSLRFHRPVWNRDRNRERSDAFLSDRFTNEGGKLQWLAQFYESNPYKPGDSIYLMLECESCRVIDLREEAFVHAFGKELRDLWRRLEANFPDLFYYREEVNEFLLSCPELQR